VRRKIGRIARSHPARDDRSSPTGAEPRGCENYGMIVFMSAVAVLRPEKS
jgi:hypothetical protein